MKPLPRAAYGSTVTLDAELYNFIAESLERLDKWSVAPPLRFQQTPSGNLLSISGQAQETVLVAIIGNETGGGCYQGCILTGSSTGMDGSKKWGPESTVINSGDTPDVASKDFQLQSSYISDYVDGPAPAANSSGQYDNNCLVINLMEQYVPGSHLLYVNMAQLMYCQGRVVGVTNETTPRKIVYVDPVVNFPVIIKITAAEQSGEYGWYYGKIAPGLFGQESITSGDPPGIPDVLPATDNCWVGNVWQNGRTTSALAAGTVVVAFIVGYGGGPIPGTSQASNTWNYVAFTFTPTAANAPSTSVLSIVTTESALATYTSNEQTMLNNLREDVNNLHDALAALHTTLVNAGLCG